MTGAEMDDDTGLLVISQENYDKLQSLYFNIGGVRPHVIYPLSVLCIDEHTGDV